MPGTVEKCNAASQSGATTEFAKRNPFLAKFIPDRVENTVDALLPDKVERVLNRGASKVHEQYFHARAEMQESIGEVAGVLFQVAKYAYEKFHLHDLVFGVYHLAQHHATVNAVDAVDGKEVDDPELVAHLIEAADAATAAYLPEREALVKAAHIADADLLIFEPETTTTRPAYAVWVDKPSKRLVWAFRGTTDLNDMLTDACASCTPYCGGYAHWGMLEAASWFATNELKKVKGLLDEHPGYELLLVGHSLGAGTAAMLAHMLKNDAAASAVIGSTPFSAVGVATPAVLTKELAEDCSSFITSVVLMHDIVPRFSIHNVFSMKEEMDATNWGDILASTAKDWAVPDVIENSKTFRKLCSRVHSAAHELKQNVKQQVEVANEKLRHNLGDAVGAEASTTSATASPADKVKGMLARWFLAVWSWLVTLLHFVGLAKPNPEVVHGQQAGAVVEAAAATAAAARAATSDARVVRDAVQNVSENMKNVAKEDVHQVFAPGRLFFIKRLDKYKGRAKYGNMDHVCTLCADHDPEAILKSSNCHAHDGYDHEEASKSAAPDGETYPGARFELIEAAPTQRFQRIVLRETCLLDHLCGGYVQGLHFALNKLQAPGAAPAASRPGLFARFRKQA